MDLPAPARAALSSHFGDANWQLLHAWISEDDRTVMAVVGVVPDEAFDEEADEYDVDSIELHMLTAFDDLQGNWEVSADGGMRLGDLFADLLEEFYEGRR